MTRGRPRSIAVASTACALVAAAVAGRLLMSTCGVHRPGAAPEEQRAAPTPAGPTLSASAPRRADDCQSTAAMQSLFRPGDRDFLPWVEWKYRYFLAELQLAACAREQLEQLLAARERLVHEAGESRA